MQTMTMMMMLKHDNCYILRELQIVLGDCKEQLWPFCGGFPKPPWICVWLVAMYSSARFHKLLKSHLKNSATVLFIARAKKT